MFGANDLDIFFSGGDAVICVLPSGSKINVLIDSADDEAFGGSVMSGSHVLTGKTSELKDLNEGDQINVDEIDYLVRYSKRIEDGKLMNVFLSVDDE